MIPVKPAISVIIAGFGAKDASWDRLRDCLQAVASQDVAARVELVLCGVPGLTGEVPEYIADILPGLRVLPYQSNDLCERKTLGVRQASAPIVAFVDADCMPQSGWVRSLLESFQYYPEVAVVRGGMATSTAGWRRLLPGKPRSAGPAIETAENNVAFRREAYLDCPFPRGSGANAVRLQTASLLRAGYVLWTEPAMQVMRDRRGLRQAGRVQVGFSSAVTR